MSYIIGGKVVKNFSLAEMANKRASDDVKLVLSPEAIEFAQMMQELRDWYGKPMEVSSWYRTASFNKSCGGASNSAHLDGRAADINSIDTTNEELVKDFITAWEVICSSHNKVGGVEVYSWGMHFDNHSDKFGCDGFRFKDNR